MQLRAPVLSLALSLVPCLAVASAPAAAQAPAEAPAPTLEQVVADQARSEANRARDAHRRPVETLKFFGVKPTDSVVELWPGGGWYTEILAPWLAPSGKLQVAGPWPNGLDRIRQKQADDPARFGGLALAAFPAREGEPRIADNSVDVVLTFRNIHNWRMGSMRGGQDYAAEAFRQIFAMLKPGGILGVVDHRLPESADDAREKSSGYIKTSTVKRLAQEAGFLLDGESELNANPKDSADWPKGVWTLPPAYREGDVDKARYQAIGESDRMTLRFVKPAR